ncbi:hypothetical protein [Sulfuriferula multivorans]|uniref:hypothetical protein n=1 Tax=Sulfuriferula multivorans TaxID=1559896 RepID=UPI000F5C21A1|nr:hypothetical protein [Sulfuriferula multivorans]
MPWNETSAADLRREFVTLARCEDVNARPEPEFCENFAEFFYPISSNKRPGILRESLAAD